MPQDHDRQPPDRRGSACPWYRLPRQCHQRHRRPAQEKPDQKQLEYIQRLTRLIAENRSEIDGFIERYAHGWKPERISRTALAVLRCAICEILYMDDIPNSAAINEAVELDKNYDEPDTVAFVNGVLGGFMRGEFPQEEA